MVLIIAQLTRTVPTPLVFISASVLEDILVMGLVAQVSKHFQHKRSNPSDNIVVCVMERQLRLNVFALTEHNCALTWSD